jgi:hypothetical protein
MILIVLLFLNFRILSTEPQILSVGVVMGSTPEMMSYLRLMNEELEALGRVPKCLQVWHSASLSRVSFSGDDRAVQEAWLWGRHGSAFVFVEGETGARQSL